MGIGILTFDRVGLGNLRPKHETHPEGFECVTSYPQPLVPAHQRIRSKEMSVLPGMSVLRSDSSRMVLTIQLSRLMAP